MQVAKQCPKGIGHQAVLHKTAGIAPICPKLSGHGVLHHPLLVAGILAQFHQRMGMLADIVGYFF